MKSKLISLLTIISIIIALLFICNIDKTMATPTTLADEVISKAGNCTSWNAGFSGICKTNNHEYRYIGTNVNNYVIFNNDLYRIIGVFDSNSTGVNANLVKLVRSRLIGTYSWGINNESPALTSYSTYTNNWEISNTKVLLNEFFYNATNTSTTYNSCSNWTYYWRSNTYRTMDCSNIVGYGMQTNNTRNYIQPVTWYLNGFDSNNYSKSYFYNCERGQTTGDATADGNCTSSNSGSNNSTINTNIGLIYVSDYLYASSYFDSSSTAKAYSNHFGELNWLYNGWQWTITPVGSESNQAFSILYGDTRKYTTDVPRAIIPVFYLKSDVYVTGGNGSFNDPYTIACDTCNN